MNIFPTIFHLFVPATNPIVLAIGEAFVPCERNPGWLEKNEIVGKESEFWGKSLKWTKSQKQLYLGINLRLLVQIKHILSLSALG